MVRKNIASSLSEAPEQLGDRSELSSLYPRPKPINTNPISTEAEKQQRQQKTKQERVRQLRRASLRIALFIAAPYIAGLFVSQQIVAGISTIAPGDIGSAMTVVFGSFALALATVAGTVAAYKQVTNEFHNHYLKAWPIVITVITCLILFTSIAQNLGAVFISGLIGYLLGLLYIAVVAIIVTTALTYVWTMSNKWKTKIATCIFTVLLFIALLVAHNVLT